MAPENADEVSIEMTTVHTFVDGMNQVFERNRAKLVGTSENSTDLITHRARFISEGEKTLSFFRSIINHDRAPRLVNTGKVPYFELTVIQPGRIMRTPLKKFTIDELDHLLDTMNSFVEFTRSLESNYYIICAPQHPPTMDPQSDLLKLYSKSQAMFTANKPRTFKDTSRAIIFAFLLLLTRDLRLSIHDVIAFFNVLIPQPSSRVQRPRFPKYDLDEWCSVQAVDSAERSSSTKTMDFPGQIPDDTSTRFLHMERKKLHGKVPQSVSKVAIWGSKREDDASWRSLIAFSDGQAASVFSERLDDLPVPATEVTEDPSEHWAYCLRYIYRLGVNDARSRLAKLRNDIKNLRYEHLSDPKVGGSLVCLTFMNHLQYHKDLTEALDMEKDSYPVDWELGPLLPETDTVTTTCRTLLEDINETHEQASNTRILIMEQLSLSQSRNVPYLTFLATVFVPMTAVAGIFGMNTIEINDSNWPTKYFAIAAVPLTVLAVLVPLSILTLIDLLLLISSHNHILILTQDFFISVALVSSVIDVAIQYTHAIDYDAIADVFFWTQFPAFISICLTALRIDLNVVDAWRRWRREEPPKESLFARIKTPAWRLAGPVAFLLLWNFDALINFLRLIALSGYCAIRGYSWYRYHARRRKLRQEESRPSRRQV